MARKKTTRRKTTASTKKRSTTRRTKKKNSSMSLANFFVPLFFIGCILACLGFLLFMGYQTVTASSFFDIEHIEVVGNKEVSTEELTRLVDAETRINGVWKADLEKIKNEIKDNFINVKDVSVSRILPHTIKVRIIERMRVALVRRNGKDFWVDKEGLILDVISVEDENPPFTMFGWSEVDTEKDIEDNAERIQLYLELLQSMQAKKLAERVKAVDLSDLRDPQVIIEDSDHTVRIILSKGGDYGERLQLAIEKIAGRGNEIKSIDMSGEKTFFRYRNS